mgnify:CR=1 FL=1
MKISISGEDKERLQQVENLAKQLGLQVDEKEWQQEKKKKKALDALENLSKMGAFNGIEDPVKWQRDQRVDRNIGRDE